VFEGEGFPAPKPFPVPEVRPAIFPSPRVKSSSPSSSEESSMESSEESSEADEEPEATGRHTVPEELVRAATYRLAPDRVARAKVREVLAGELTDDPTSRLADGAVPKPRTS
jgi:hypothetical protein